MANERLSNLTISFIKRNAPLRGPTSSEMINDSFEEVANDLTHISEGWNTSLVPLLETIPDGTDDEDIDAFENGLDGKTLYVDSAATSLNNSDYFDSTNNRPKTVFEQLEDIYEYIDTEITDVESEIADLNITASDIPITDINGYFSATNVETALAELKQDLDFTTDHGSLTGLSDDDHTQYLPRSGVRAMTGNLNLDGHNITSVLGITLTGNITIAGHAYIGHLAGTTAHADIPTTGTISGLRKNLSAPITGYSVTVNDSNTILRNLTGSKVFNLASLGSTYYGACITFLNRAAGGTLQINAPSGKKIYYGNTSSSASGSITSESGTNNPVLTVLYDAGDWYVINAIGTWNVA